MIIGSTIYRTQVCYNSMEWAREHVSEAPDGSLFLSDKLVSARGRQGRVWHISDGQLLITMILKPDNLSTIALDDLPLRLNQLNMAINCGILAPLKHYGTVLKWPNDFYARNKKLGGMIMQLIWDNDRPQGIIIGFALNVNNTFELGHELFSKAISLTMITSSRVDKELLQQEVLASCDRWYKQWQQGNAKKIVSSWKHEQYYLGKNITAHLKNGGSIAGLAHDILPNGDLILVDKKTNKRINLSFFTVDQVDI